jgi:deoxyribonuclease-4
MYFGAHVSIAGGLPNAPVNAAKIGCEVFQMFTRSPRGGFVAPLNKQIVADFKNACEENNQKEWYVHAPYFINYASANARVKNGSVTVVREELERSSLLGAKYLMTHLGSYKDLGREKGFSQLVDGLAQTVKGYKGTTQFLLEISAGASNAIGDTFENMGEILHHKKLEKYNIGVCYDTQHAFAAGYDCRTPKALEKTLQEFDKHIGLDRLKLFHCNDSKTELGSHRDRHHHIGEGEIGISGFKSFLTHPALQQTNFVLETEDDAVVKDLQILKKLRK